MKNSVVIKHGDWYATSPANKFRKTIKLASGNVSVTKVPSLALKFDDVETAKQAFKSDDVEYVDLTPSLLESYITYNVEFNMRHKFSCDKDEQSYHPPITHFFDYAHALIKYVDGSYFCAFKYPLIVNDDSKKELLYLESIINSQIHTVYLIDEMNKSPFIETGKDGNLYSIDLKTQSTTMIKVSRDDILGD